MGYMAKGIIRGRSSLPSKSLDCCTILFEFPTAKSSGSRTSTSLLPESAIRLARSFESCLALELYPSWKHLANPSCFRTAWFTHIHAEQNLQTAIDRYGNESKRIMGVVDSSPRKQRQKLGHGADGLSGLLAHLRTLHLPPGTLFFLPRYYLSRGHSRPRERVPRELSLEREYA
ncbi:hypothetical protein M434DRAFT_27877 [Hypoxylon sp. CO27-5]|nr:hypothetical protein M434DRAFT_27877 [Hypoxylon sp. CO27-5]